MKDRRVRWVVAGVLLVAGIAGVIFLTGGGDEEVRSRRYGAFTSCLLTDQEGIAGAAAAPAWAGMQDASLATLTKVQYLSVIGGQTADNAATFVASMVQSRCDLVILTGEAPRAAAVAAAGRFPEQRFVAISDQPGEARDNLTWLSGSPEALRIEVGAAIRDAVGAG